MPQLRELTKATRRTASRTLNTGLLMSTKAEGERWARELGSVPGLVTYRLSRRGSGPGGWDTRVLVWIEATGDPCPWLDDLITETTHVPFVPLGAADLAKLVTAILRRHPLSTIDAVWRLGGIDALAPFVRLR